MMEECQKRVIEEKEELDNKIAKLKSFINESPVFVEMAEKQQKLLCQQYCHMEDYSDVLGERIADFMVH
jgi:hypothetical protein